MPLAVVDAPEELELWPVRVWRDVSYSPAGSYSLNTGDLVLPEHAPV